MIGEVTPLAVGRERLVFVRALATMNDYVGPDSFAIEPSIDLPCSRLPFVVHRSLCSALDLSDRWKGLAAHPLLDLGSDEVRRIEYARENKKQSCTNALLEHLWVTKGITVGDVLDVLQEMEFSKGSLATLLGRYLEKLIPELEFSRNTAPGPLTEDPRQPVSRRALQAYSVLIALRTYSLFC